jgi:hypothetical protein
MASGRLSKVKGKVLDIPTPPTIGTATDSAAGGIVSVPFTAYSGSVGGPTFSYTALSNPGSVTATGTTSPITVTGLTNDTAYTFTVAGVNPTGTGQYSAASNSVTPTAPPNSYESIATVTLGSSQSSITFSSIPATFKHLQVRWVSQDDRATYPISEIKCVFNSDTGANYSYHQLAGDGGSAYAQGGTSASFIQIEIGGTTTGGTFGGGVMDILDYASTGKYKTTKALSGVMTNADYSGYYGIITENAGNWRSTSAITSMTFSPRYASNFTQYTKYALYGIKG